MASYMKDKAGTLKRIENFIHDKHGFYDCCNLRGRLHPKRVPVIIRHHAAVGRVTYDDAIAGQYKPASVGDIFGPTWSTHWFKLDITIPKDWEGKEVWLLWNSQSEAMVWKDGKPIQGLSACPDDYLRTDFILTRSAAKNEFKQTLYIEMACNGLFGAGLRHIIRPPDLHKKFALTQAEIAIVDPMVYDLLVDMEVMLGLAKHLPEQSHRAYEAMLAANEMINIIEIGEPKTYERAKEKGASFFAKGNGDSQITIHAVGHSHIDSAWLWSYAETKRKCARSWSSSLLMMKDYPDFTFACSQAQQYQWMKEDYPSIYDDIKTYVARGQFIPVCGTWVEMDGNLPSGESFVRQFLYGQRYFRQEFDVTCREFWLPDTFGYAPQLPQIMSQSGISRFITQKMSWNKNKFPHHTFHWEGLDGTKVLTHFPPGDNYGMKGDVDEVMKTLNNCEDKGRIDNLLFLYGYGDGGGGPNPHMVEKLKRMHNTDGCPRVKFSSPDAMMSLIEEHESPKLCKWVGELYFETHQGTYTTQSQIKRENRKGEVLFHNLEFISTLALRTQSSSSLKSNAYVYSADDIERMWKLFLLNQFHDVLPGSSINEVNNDAIVYYKEIQEKGQALLNGAISAVFQDGKGPLVNIALNGLGWSRTEVVEVGGSDEPKTPKQKRKKIKTEVPQTGRKLALVTVPAYGAAKVDEETGTDVKEDIACNATVDKQTGSIVLQNRLIEATVDKIGKVVSLKMKSNGRECIDGGCGNQFVLYTDRPASWDAWNVEHYHLETRKEVFEVIEAARIVEKSRLRVEIKVNLKISDSSNIIQNIVLDAESPYLRFNTEVAWHEDHKFLKVEFPVNCRSDVATYDTQYGFVRRPTHANTSWDWFKFEVCTHKWADLSEYNFGVAILNDCKYGFQTSENVMRLSLLKSPKAPDEVADMGNHTFTYAILPHENTFQDAGVIRNAANLNNPLIVKPINGVKESLLNVPFFQVDTDSIIIDTIKKSEDSDNAIIIRAYESFGGTCVATITMSFRFSCVHGCNMLEDVDPEEIRTPNKTSIAVDYKPFQVKTFKVKF